jgi:hypothetical protein
MLFVLTTTSAAGYYEITHKFYNMIKAGAVAKGVLNIGLTAMLLACAAVILASGCGRWLAVLKISRGTAETKLEVEV